MPNCFQLFRRVTGFEKNLIHPARPEVFSKIDVEICALLDVPVDDVRYCMDWYDTIGFRLACGKTFEENAKYFEDRIEECEAKSQREFADEYRKLAKINDWLDEHFVVNSWVEIGRRD
jgi:hypothetical protein